jgi:tetratricopeptide (TPR) repeat protein
MKMQRNQQAIKRLLRVISTLNGFELIICGYQSQAIYKEMFELVLTTSLKQNIPVKNIDLSGTTQFQDWENLLRENIESDNKYQLFNIIGLTRERLAANYPYAFFFWLPENLISRFTLDAPDLWAWRNTVFVFEDDDRKELIKLIPIKTYIGENFVNFKKKEQEREFDYLSSLMMYVKNLPESRKQEKKFAEIYHDMGKLSYSMKYYSNALTYYKLSLDLRIRKKGRDLKEIALIYFDMAVVYQTIADYDQAFQCYWKSLNFSFKWNDRELKAAIYNNTGILFRLIGEDNLAFDSYSSAKDLFLELDNGQGIGAAINNIGIIYELHRNFKAALEAFKESETIFDGNKNRNELSCAVVLNNIAHVYYSGGNYDEAANCLRIKASILEKNDFKGRSIVTLYKISELFKEAEKDEESITWLRRAHRFRLDTLTYPENRWPWEQLIEKYEEKE